jgi:hypothetical protein
MNRDDIQVGHSYWIRVGELPERRVLVDWSCPAHDPSWFCCWDIASGIAMSLSADDFLRPCDDEVTWEELLELGPEHREAARQTPRDGEPSCVAIPTS